MIWNYLIVVVLVALSGVFSGLTIGLFSLDLSGVERQAALGNKNAKLVYPIRKRGNLLLCTLLLGNVATNSALSIFLGSIASGVIAGLVATSLIVVFGEILPAAVFTKYALVVGARSVPLVKLFLYGLYPVAYPLASVLDKFLGAELPTLWGKQELALILEEHRKAKDSDVDEDDARIAIGALSYSEKTAEQTMTPANKVFTVGEGDAVDQKALDKIASEDFKRIPVIKTKGVGVLGVLNVSTLIGYDVSRALTFGKMKLISDAPVFDAGERLDHILERLIQKQMSMGLVTNESAFLGIVTVEDILEEIVQKELDA